MQIVRQSDLVPSKPDLPPRKMSPSPPQKESTNTPSAAESGLKAINKDSSRAKVESVKRAAKLPRPFQDHWYAKSLVDTYSEQWSEALDNEKVAFREEWLKEPKPEKSASEPLGPVSKLFSAQLSDQVIPGLPSSPPQVQGMDPFECRIKFTDSLKRLGASRTGAERCATFALKHREYAEDLHNCVLEQFDEV